MARRDPGNAALRPLMVNFAKHHAALKCQTMRSRIMLPALKKHGRENYPLYAWTKATIENPAKKEKYTKSFTVYAAGNEVYEKEIADALQRDLQPLVGGALVTRMSKHDTNPANNPQPPARFR